jgi:TPR repeat protein
LKLTAGFRKLLVLAFIGVLAGIGFVWNMHERSLQRRLADNAAACQTRAEKGDAAAEYCLGHVYFEGEGVPRDYDEALSWYRRAADQGYALAEASLGYMYLQGTGVARDYGEAIRWFTKAADQGNANAEYNLGSIYRSGNGVTQDFEKAVYWYKKAASQDDANAEYGIGFMLFNGQGIQQDRAQAAHEYRLAANQGLARAEYDLAYMEFYGQGVVTNHVEAYRLFHAAAEQGDERAKRSLRAMNREAWTNSTVTISALGSLLFLVSTFYRQNTLDRTQYRIRFLAALLGLSYSALAYYSYSRFWIFGSEWIEYEVSFATGFLLGCFLAFLSLAFIDRRASLVLGLSIVLLLAFDLFAPLHYDLKESILATRGFCSVNGLLLGILVPCLVYIRSVRPGQA